MRNLGHVAAGEFVAAEEGAVYQGNVDLGEEFGEVEFDLVPTVNVGDVEEVLVGAVDEVG